MALPVPPPSLTNAAQRSDSLYQTFGGITGSPLGNASLLEQATPLLLAALAFAALFVWRRG